MMKIDYSSVFSWLITGLVIIYLLGWWGWIFYDGITNDPEILIFFGLWLGPILFFPVLRFVARLTMSEAEKKIDDEKFQDNKNDGLALLMTIWALGFPILYLFIK